MVDTIIGFFCLDVFLTPFGLAVGLLAGWVRLDPCLVGGFI